MKKQTYNRFSQEWFKERAFGSLRKIEDGKWDYSDSLLTYSPQAVKAYRNIQEGETNYSFLITKPEVQFLEGIAQELVASLPDSFDYIDLGPGTEHKEEIFFRAMQSAKKNFRYVPVDISPSVLTNVSQFAQNLRIEVSPIQAPFEECSNLLKGDRFRFVSIGLTFINYNPEYILNALKKLQRKNGASFIDIHVRERIDPEVIRKMYQDEVLPFIDPKVELLGTINEDISEKEATDGVKIWYTLRHINKVLAEKGLREGDKLLMLQTLRHPLSQITRIIKGIFPNAKVFDNGSPFVGYLLK